MSRRFFTSSSMLAGLIGASALSCESIEVGPKIGPICPGCVAGGESSDFSGGSYPLDEDLCEAYHVVSEPLEAEGTSDDAVLVEDVRRRLAAAAAHQFQWSAPEMVDSGAPATGYDPGIISVDMVFEFGETFVERLDPTTCADGFCLHFSQLARCALREERWLRQDFDLRLKTSDQAIDATLSGSARITMDGRFVTGQYVQGGQPQASVSSVTGTLRIAPSVPGEPVLSANLDLFESQLRGSVGVQLDAMPGTGQPFFPTYLPIFGEWPVHEDTADGATGDDDCPWATLPSPADVAQQWLAGKAPQQLASEVKAATTDAQTASWDSGGTEVVHVSYEASAGSRACVGLSAVWLPDHRVTVTTADAGIDVHWDGLLIRHEAGEVVGFESSARFEYDAAYERIGKEIDNVEEPDGDRQSVDVSVRDAKTKVDSGHGTWTATAFPAWDLTLSRSNWVDCPGAHCRPGDPLACMGTDAYGYNACNDQSSLPTVCVDASNLVTRIGGNQPPPVNPGSPSIAPAPPGVSPPPATPPIPTVCSTPVTPVNPSVPDDGGLTASEPSPTLPADAGMSDGDAAL